MNFVAVGRALSGALVRAEAKFLRLSKTDNFQQMVDAFKDLVAIQACQDALRMVERKHRRRQTEVETQVRAQVGIKLDEETAIDNQAAAG